MTNNGHNSSAVNALIGDLLENILRFSNNPGGCADYITTQIRELIGVRLVAVIEQTTDGSGIRHKLVGICPARKKSYWNQPGVQAFVSLAATYENPCLIDPATDPAGKLLSSLGIGRSFVIPLLVGNEKIGTIILLDLMDPKGASTILETLTKISGVIALVLRNSFLYRNLENLVEIKTRQIAEQERLFRVIASNTPDHIVMQDSELRYVFVINPQLGLTEQDMIGKTDYDFLSKEEADKITQVKRQVMETGKPHHIEASLISKEGNPEFFDGTYVPIFDAQGKVDGLIGYFRNITKIKKAGEALRESEERFRKIFEEGPLGIAMATLPDGRLISVNRALCEMLGYREEELKRLTFLNVTHPDHRAVDIEAVKGLQAGHIQRHITEKRYLKKNGEVIWALRALTKIVSSEDKSSYALSMIEDITKRKQAEEELRKYRDYLEDLVKERTLELGEAQEALVNIVEDLNEKSVQLAQAMEQAQSADHLKSAFLATMSHELRTPLNSIIGFIGIVLQEMSGPLNDEQAKQLGMVQSSANHLLSLINDVLDISKIEAGQVQIARKSFDLRSVIESALRTVLPLAVKIGLSLDSAIASDVGVIISDRRRVEQILINLLNNAVKFTEKGKIRVTAKRRIGVSAGKSVSANGSNGVTARRVNSKELFTNNYSLLTDTDFVEISVADTGIGIKPEDMDKIFKPFRQVETGLTRNYEGTGLGLSICEKLVGMLGGTIRVESEWGKGSTFIFTLPLSS